MKSKIISTGSYLPSKILNNKHMESIVETTNEWILERTGIEERHIAADNEVTSDLAYKASVIAIERAKINISDIDAIIVATTTPDRTFPSVASILQYKLHLQDKCFATDVQAVCCGFIYALDIADSLIKTNKAKTVLVIGAETISRLVDWKDRNTCILFGDGAGAVILQATDDNGTSDILTSTIHTDGQYFELLKTNGGVSFNRTIGYIEMEGKEVFKLAVNKMADCVLESLNKINLTTKDINLLIPHQANKRIIDGVGKKLELDNSKVIVTIEHQGNTSSASVPLALDYAVTNNKIKSNDIVVLEALGSGLTWGSIIVRW